MLPPAKTSGPLTLLNFAQVYDLKFGGLVRDQKGHRGYVSCMLYANEFSLMFSGSVDGTVGVWDERGFCLQMAYVGGAVTSLAVDIKFR